MSEHWQGWNRKDWACHLSNLCWHLRNVRAHDQAGRRRWYRKLEVEKARLIASGIDAELVRLVARYYKDPNDFARARRIEARERALADRVPERFTGRQVFQSGSSL